MRVREGSVDLDDRGLAFRLALRTYRVPAAAIAGVARPAGIRPVPLAPPEVMGLTEWRGRLLTVLDLPRMLDDRPLDAPASLIRLPAPFERTALYVPGPVWLPAEEGDAAALEEDTPICLRPAELVERLRHRFLGSEPRRRPRPQPGQQSA